MNRMDSFADGLMKHPEAHGLEGIGDQVISLPLKDLRRLAEVPPDVEFIRTLQAPSRRDYDATWYLPEIENQAFFHIRHRFCFRCQPGQVLCWERFDDFLARYKQLEERYGVS